MGPMDRLGVDLFHYEGKDFLIMVDHYLNFKLVKELNRAHTEDVIKAMEAWFCMTGLLQVAHSHRGPQLQTPTPTG